MAHHELQIEKLVPGGEAFGRLPDGKPVLVRGPLPGDRIRLLRARERKSFVKGEAWRLLRPSPERRAAVCPIAEACGGCDWLELEESAQKREKLGLFLEALRRVGGFYELPNVPKLITAESLHYRTRVRFQVDHQGRFGFFGARSHALVEVHDCQVLSPALLRGLHLLRQALSADASAMECFESVEIVAVPREAEAQSGSQATRGEGAAELSFFFRRRKPRRRATQRPSGEQHPSGEQRPSGAANTDALLWRLSEYASVSIEGEPSATDEGSWLRFALDPRTYAYVPPGGFCQAHWGINRHLIQRVCQGALERKVKTFADLYCGSGNFSLPLLRAGLSGVGVEENAQSIACVQKAAREQGFAQATFVAEGVEAAAERWGREGKRFDLVVADPPRAGLGAAVTQVAGLAREWIALCACDPATMARDLKQLCGLGFELEHLDAYDMFPQTHHVEGFAWLRRQR